MATVTYNPPVVYRQGTLRQGDFFQNLDDEENHVYVVVRAVGTGHKGQAICLATGVTKTVEGIKCWRKLRPGEKFEVMV